jgi:hypothetical protein
MHSEPARVILANARIQDITTAEDWPSRAAPAGFWSWRGHVAAPRLDSRFRGNDMSGGVVTACIDPARPRCEESRHKPGAEIR